jgi:hypothetical protein
MDRLKSGREAHKRSDKRKVVPAKALRYADILVDQEEQAMIAFSR